MQDDDDDDNGGDSSEAIRIEMTEVASAERHLREQFGDAGLGVTLALGSSWHYGTNGAQIYWCLFAGARGESRKTFLGMLPPGAEEDEGHLIYLSRHDCDFLRDTLTQVCPPGSEVLDLRTQNGRVDAAFLKRIVGWRAKQMDFHERMAGGSVLIAAEPDGVTGGIVMFGVNGDGSREMTQHLHIDFQRSQEWHLGLDFRAGRQLRAFADALKDRAEALRS